MGSSAIRLDTLAIAKELEESGIPVKQAEAQTRVYAKVISMVVEDQLATKQDLQKVEIGLKQDVQIVTQNLVKVEQALKQDIRAVEHKLIQVEQSLRQDIQAVEQKVVQVEQSLRQDIQGLDRRVIKLEEKIETQALKLTVRLGGLLVAGIAVLAALIKL